MKPGRADLRKAVKGGEENALETLVELFDWLDTLEQQPVTNIVPLYQESQNIMSMIADTHEVVVAGKAEESDVSCPPCLHMTLKAYADWE